MMFPGKSVRSLGGTRRGCADFEGEEDDREAVVASRMEVGPAVCTFDATPRLLLLFFVALAMEATRNALASVFAFAPTPTSALAPIMSTELCDVAVAVVSFVVGGAGE